MLDDHFIKLTHDRFFKCNMYDLKVAKALICQILPPDYLDKFVLDSLAIYPTEYIQRFSGKQLLADVVYSLASSDALAPYLCIHIEAQSQPDPFISFRMKEVAVAIQRRHLMNLLKNKKGRSCSPIYLPVVLPAIFYTGEQPYLYGTSWADCIYPSQRDLFQQVLTQPIPILKVRNIDTQQMANYGRTGLMYYGFKHVKDENWIGFLKELVTLLNDLLRQYGQNDQTLLKQFESVLVYLTNNNEYIDSTENLESKLLEMFESIPKTIGGIVMTIRDLYIDQGKQEGVKWGIEQGIGQGVKQGIEQGVRQEKYRVAASMLKVGLSEVQISQCTGLSADELSELHRC